MKQKYFELLRKKQQGQISLQEDQELKQWVEAEEENEATADVMDQIWPLTEKFGDDATPNTEVALGRLMDRIKADKEIVEKVPPARVRPLRRQLGWIAVAASLVLAIGLGWQFWNTDAPQWATVSTQSAESSAIQLEDGSKVWINQQSTLNYPENIASADRTLSLYGEAYFEVAPQKDRPFTIELNGAKVEVLGTAFNIRSYPNSPLIEVTVSHGKVRFTSVDNGQSQVLTDNDQIIYNRQTGEVVSRKDKNLWALAWQTKDLQFKNTALSTALRALGRYYNVSIELDNPELANCNFTNTFNEQSVNEALAIVARAFHLEVQEVSNLEYLLKGGSCD